MNFMGPFGYSQRLGGATRLDLDMLLITYRFALLRDICQPDQPWIFMM